MQISPRIDDQSILSTPRARKRPIRLPGPDSFGTFSETFARYMGTPGFIGWMTGVITAWVSWNVLAPAGWQFDSYPFQFLVLALSLQASYAAPLILLAQNRQERRDRLTAEQDRVKIEQSRADTDFLAREIMDIRTRLGEMPTRSFLTQQLGRLEDKLG